MLNRQRSTILLITSAIVLLMLLFPPFIVVTPEAKLNAGYGFFFSPPYSGLALVNVSLLSVQLFVVALGAGVAWIFIGTQAGRKAGQSSPFGGGDGSSAGNAVVLNCASMAIARRLIDRFISERHGQKTSNWTIVTEYFVRQSNVPPDSIRSVSVDCNDGSKHTYYFDISRQVKNMDRMAGI